MLSFVSKVVAAFSSFATMHDHGPVKELFAMVKVRVTVGESEQVILHTNSRPGTCTFCSVDAWAFDGAAWME